MKDEMMPLFKTISSNSAKSALVPRAQREEITGVNRRGASSSTALFKLALSVSALSSVLIVNQERAVAADSMPLPSLTPAPHQGYQLVPGNSVAGVERRSLLTYSSVQKGKTLWEISDQLPLPTSAAIDAINGSSPKVTIAETLTVLRRTSEIKLTQPDTLVLSDTGRLGNVLPRQSKLKLATLESEPTLIASALHTQQRQEQALKNLRQKKQQLSTSLHLQPSSDSSEQKESSEPKLVLDLPSSNHREEAGPSFAAQSEQEPILDTSGADSGVEAAKPPLQPLWSLNPVYQVEPGDTLQQIASRYQVSYSQLAAANQLQNPDLIRVNQQLQIPRQESLQNPANDLPVATTEEVGSELAQATNQQLDDTYAEKLRADVAKLQQEYRAPRQELIETNIESTDAKQTGRQQQARRSRSATVTATAPVEIEYYSRLQPLAGEMVEPELPPLSSPEPYLPDSNSDSSRFNGYIWPAAGVLTSGYGRRWGRMHKGIDVAGPIGTPIVAVASGQVVFAGWNSGGYGNLVKVKHDNGSLSLYAHNSRIMVRLGQYVEQGQLIAKMGNSGYSTGPHLHFEIHPEGKGAANPMAYLPKLK